MANSIKVNLHSQTVEDGIRKTAVLHTVIASNASIARYDLPHILHALARGKVTEADITNSVFPYSLPMSF